NRFHVHGAHGLGGRFNRFMGVHCLSGCRSGSQRDEDNEKNCKKTNCKKTTCSPHLPLFIGSRKSIYAQAQSAGQIVCFIPAVTVVPEDAAKRLCSLESHPSLMAHASPSIRAGVASRPRFAPTAFRTPARCSRVCRRRPHQFASRFSSC